MKIEANQKILEKVTDKKTLEEMQIELENLKGNKQALEWRLEKDIAYGKNFLSNKIDE